MDSKRDENIKYSDYMFCVHNTCQGRRSRGAGGAIAPPKIQVEEHCSPYILRVRLNTEQPKSSIDTAVAL